MSPLSSINTETLQRPVPSVNSLGIIRGVIVPPLSKTINYLSLKFMSLISCYCNIIRIFRGTKFI